MFEAYDGLRQETAAIIAFQLGDFFEFFESDALVVSRVCGIAMSQRGLLPNGAPRLMCGVPADLRFLPAEDRQLIPLFPSTVHYFGHIVEAGHPLAVAVYRNGRDGRDGWKIAATFDPADFAPAGRVRKAPTLVPHQA
ncbi:hypothetical protein [Tabrizicola sp.]|uniref:hypothetical protein n=1 Tax=Tabrizicola sp. TaxID=2005166 RepID=UPI0035B43FCB